MKTTKDVLNFKDNDRANDDPYKDTGHPRELQFRPRHQRDDQLYHDDVTAIDASHDGMTIQAPAEDADINVLMRRMGVKDGSELPYFTNPRAMFGDFSEFTDDPTEMANIIREGELAFLKLPAEIRQRYETPEKLFEWMNDDSNYDEAVKLGLLQKKPVKDVKDATKVSSSTSSDKEQLVPAGSSTSTSKGDK